MVCEQEAVTHSVLKLILHPVLFDTLVTCKNPITELSHRRQLPYHCVNIEMSLSALQRL